MVIFTRSILRYMLTHINLSWPIFSRFLFYQLQGKPSSFWPFWNAHMWEPLTSSDSPKTQFLSFQQTRGQQRRQAIARRPSSAFPLAVTPGWKTVVLWGNSNKHNMNIDWYLLLYYAKNCIAMHSGVSIISKNWLFYKVWYERFEFFLGRPSVVFIKGG